MNDNSLQWILVENRHELLDFVGSFVTQSAFDRQMVGNDRYCLIQKHVDFFRKWQQTGAALLFGDHWVGTTQIPVHGVIAHVKQLRGKRDEILRIIADDLRFNGHRRVVFR